jgi:type VI protein secretion system component VasF
MNQHPEIRPQEADSAFVVRQRLRERQKLWGLLLLLLFILVLAFVRFGKTIPWGAR